MNPVKAPNVAPKVSVLITTFNRSALLRRALASVLAQDYDNIDVVVIDDCSADDTPHVVAEFVSPRLRYVRNEVNVGSKSGDLAIIKRFLEEFCDGDMFVYLCDDDYWLPTNLISRAVAAFTKHRSIAFVQGGMVHCYPHPVPKLAPNEDYVSYSFLDVDKTQVFWGTLFPPGFIRGTEYLRLFAQDPKNRNIVIGATVFDTVKFKASGSLGRADGVRWQAGYAILAGAATQGDVYYLDEPCVMTAVDRNNASHRGTQLAHLQDCVASINAAFGDNVEFIELRNAMMRAVFKLFMCNKIAHKWGWFATNAMGDISDIMLPPISADDFLKAMEGVPLSRENRKLIEASDLPLVEVLSAIGSGVDVPGWHRVLKMAS
jgi:glycosyltransferase involved in cell wall biosynthesis